MPKCLCESNEDVLEFVRLSESVGDDEAADILDLDWDDVEKLRETQEELEDACEATIHFPSLLASGFDLPPIPDAGRAANDERVQTRAMIQHSKFGPFDKKYGPGYKRDNRRY